MTDLVSLTCVCCSKTFEKTKSFLSFHPDTKFCSKECYHEDKRKNEKLVTCTCQTCNKEFTVKESAFKFRGAKYCSKDCSGKNRRVPVTCETCGKEFTRIPSQPNKKFCSLQCRYDSQIGEHRAEYITYVCENCGKDVPRLLSQIDPNLGIFCDMKCFRESRITSSIVSCNWCGKKITRPPCRMNTKYGQHCSQECYWKTRRKVTRESLVNTFWNKVKKDKDPNGCWIWMGSRNDKNYGTFWVEGKNVLAHRFGYELQTGEKIPEGFFVCHGCDNPPCIRVGEGHTFANTVDVNNFDKYTKNRTSKGSELPQTVLTPEEVHIIRNLAKKNLSYKDIAEIIGNKITINAVGNIIKGYSWKHI